MDAGGKRVTGNRMWLSLLAVGLSSLVFHSLYYDVGLKNLIDLGVMAVDSERILYGQVFSHDFIAPYGPGRYYFIAALFKVFGSSMTVLCGVLLVLRVAVDLCAYRLAMRLLPAVPALFVLLCAASAHGPSHKGFLTLWLLLLIGAAIRVLDQPGSRRFAMLGITVGLAGSFRYDLGVAGLVLSGMVLVMESRGAGPGKNASAWWALGVGMVAAALPAAVLILSGDPALLLSSELSRANVLKEAQALPPGIWEGLSTWIQPAGSLFSLLLLAAAPLALLTSVACRWRAKTAEEK
ncbi:MAG: hypothetical protein ABIK28_02060, partial [Planctomycetota bacterium]